MPSPSPRSAAALQLRDILDAILFGGALFLFTRSLVTLTRHLLAFYITLGVSNTVEEFNLWRFLVISLLPFGFNLTFGLYFGHLFNDFLDRVPSAVIGLFANPALWGVLLWLAIFNLPYLAAARWASPLPLPHWPAPETLYKPLQVELLLYGPLGNRALLAGFFFRVGAHRLGPLMSEEWRKILGHESR